jgi:hypothetical protein
MKRQTSTTRLQRLPHRWALYRNLRRWGYPHSIVWKTSGMHHYNSLLFDLSVVLFILIFVVLGTY